MIKGNKLIELGQNTFLLQPTSYPSNGASIQNRLVKYYTFIIAEVAADSIKQPSTIYH